MATRSRQPRARMLTGSETAKRTAAVFLEALGGLRSTQSAADELGIAMPRYYVLEARMLQAMIEALEPRARGRKRKLDSEIAQLQDENAKLQREAMRLQALYRMTQRAVGVKEDKPSRKASKSKTSGKKSKTRRVRRKTRGERVLEDLRSEPSPVTSDPATMPVNPQPNQKLGEN